MRIAINGFGRIGRNFLRTIFEDPQCVEQLNVVAINIGPADIDKVAHMFTYDTLMRKFKGTVTYAHKELIVNGHRIALLAITEPEKLNWSHYDIDWVVEASGQYATEELSMIHNNAGSRYTLITAPCKGYVVTIIPGVNEQSFDMHKDRVVSLGSCTTNAVMPILKIMHDAFTIQQGFMTTVHAYTNSQVLIDVERDDLRRSRAAALNIIPTSTGASRMIDQVMPSLKGRITANSIRVPVATVSLIDLVLHTAKVVEASRIIELFEKASATTLHSIAALSFEPLVSSDYIGSPYSVVLDAQLIQAQSHMAKLFGWYDNEWGYSMRLRDFLWYVHTIQSN